MLSRSVFVKKLKKLGDTPVPNGHARRNKGITTYFFKHIQIEEVYEFCRNAIGSDPEVLRGYCPVALMFRDKNGEPSFAIQLGIGNNFVSVSIL